MKAWVLPETVCLTQTTTPLRLEDLPVPTPGSGQIRVRVSACGVCHTELDEIEGRTAPPHRPIVPGHEVIGYVDEVGPQVARWQPGDRVGVGWIHHSSGGADENLVPEFCATGRDVNGGYAEYLLAAEDYAFPIPEVFDDARAAPLLCAGAIGYRALRLTGLKDGERLGLTGFGGSAHLVLQVAAHLFPHTEVFVFARDEESRRFAQDLGAVWTGHTDDRSPQPLHAVIDTTPAWKPVVAALPSLRPGGRLVINAIRKEDGDRSELLKLSYHEHLWMEREIKTVANITQYDIREFLPLAAEIPLHPRIQTYAFADANQAILDLKHRNVQGAKVLLID